MTRARKPNEKFDAAAQRRYLKRYAETGMKGLSAEVAGVTSECVRIHRNASKAFKLKEAQAYEKFCDSLEEEARRRAQDGVLEPVFQGGLHVGDKRRFSDTLMDRLLKRHRPKEYSERSAIDMNVQGGVLVTPGKAVNDADWEKRHRRPDSDAEESAGS